MPVYDATTAQCRLFTFKEGLLSRVAHDLELDVGRFEVELDGGAVRATFDPTSLVVLHAVKNGSPDSSALSDKDKAQILENIRTSVLHPERFPEIVFECDDLEDEGDSLFIPGSLRLHGVERSIDVEARREDGQWVAEVSLHQPDFGIKPFTAMLGAIKVKPTMKVRIFVPSED